jgi:hypothetical protein
VKVLPEQRTTLEVKLRKNEHGEPTKSPVYFTLRYEPLPGASVPQALPE